MHGGAINTLLCGPWRPAHFRFRPGDRPGCGQPITAVQRVMMCCGLTMSLAARSKEIDEA